MNIIDSIERFSSASPVASIAHLVMEDFNVEDSNIDYCLKYISEHAAEYEKDHWKRLVEDDVESEMQKLIAFLEVLRLIPEDIRIEHHDHYLGEYE